MKAARPTRRLGRLYPSQARMQPESTHALQVYIPAKICYKMTLERSRQVSLLGEGCTMKAPKFRHSRGTAPRQGLALCLLLALLLGPGFALAQQIPSDIDFVCPCTIEYHGPSTVKVKAGIKNYSDTASERFKLNINAYRSDDGGYLGFAYHVFDPLAAGATIDRNTPIVVPIDMVGLGGGVDPGNSSIRFRARLQKLEQGWIDQLSGWLPFMPTTLPFAAVDAGSQHIYIEGAPQLQVNGNRATVTIPKLFNTHPDAVTLGAYALHATHAPYRDGRDAQGYLATTALSGAAPSLTVQGRGSASNVSFSFRGNWMPPTASYPYTYLVISGSASNGEWAQHRQTIVARGGRTIPVTSDFGTATSIDYHADADADGISDYSEGLLNTDPNDANSKPEATVLYVMARYTAAWAELNSEPLATITHHLEWANMALRNSRVDAQFKLSKAREGVVGKGNATLSAERRAAGADLMALFATTDEVTISGCGGATLGFSHPLGRVGEGDQLSAVTVAGCRTSTFAHELGHNLGLGHSAQQANNSGIGTFRWSRGHGVLDEFHTIMAYSSAYSEWLNPEEMQVFSNPDIRCKGYEDYLDEHPCGAAKDQPLAADAASTLRNFMPLAARWAPDPPDDDNDGIINFLDAFPNDPARTTDTDGDGTDDKADQDDDNDGLADVEEAELGTNPRRADTDEDGVNDKVDAFPNDSAESMDADGDGVGANTDANDNDASVKWTRKNVTLTADATLAANLIATFDDTTEGPAEIRGDTAKYEVTGVFADASVSNWNLFESDNVPRHWRGFSRKVGRVGPASVNTQAIAGTTGGEATGTIKIKGVVLAGDYINFLGSGGGKGRDIGVKVFAAGTSTLLVDWERSHLNCEGSIYPVNDEDWKHFDVSTLAGLSVDILIYDNESSDFCYSYLAFDHFYQSDSARGRLIGTAAAPPDTDGDGLSDAREAVLGTNPNKADSDEDGVNDGMDAFPLDAGETTDTDGDKIGNNADPDDDNDGLTDIEETALGTNSLLADTDGDNVGDNADAFPNDRTETADSDSDGVGDNADAFPNDASETADSDGDGTGDNADAFPNDASETADSDGDGVGDNADAFPNDASETADSDGDGVGDNADAFPNDRTETADSDGDGVGDNADAFPNDASETADSDGDGIGDNADAFPNDRTETADSDGDGVGDNADAFPNDASETADSDGDGVGDNADAFPDDPKETADSDGDGTGDNADAFPNDRTETADSDGDGVGDNADAFPDDASETADSDSDGVGDNADAFPNDRTETADSDGDGTGDNADAFPNDRSETADSDGDGVGDNADAFPDDPKETADSDGDGIGDNADAFPNDRTETADTTLTPSPTTRARPPTATVTALATTLTPSPTNRNC